MNPNNEFTVSRPSAPAFLTPASAVALSERPRPSDILRDWRERNAIHSASRLSDYAATMNDVISDHKQGECSEQQLFDAFANFAAEIRTAKMHLEVAGMLSSDAAQHFEYAREELVEAAIKSTNKVHDAVFVSALERTDEAMRFGDFAKPRINSFREFFFNVSQDLKEAQNNKEFSETSNQMKR